MQFAPLWGLGRKKKIGLWGVVVALTALSSGCTTPDTTVVPSGVPDSGGKSDDIGAEIDANASAAAITQVLASASEVAAALSTTVRCTQYERLVGGSASCHSQGITRIGGATATSCQDEEANQGVLTVYEDPLEAYSETGTGDEPRIVKPDTMRDSWDHPVVGHAVEATPGTSKPGLFPIVSSSSRETAGRVEIRDDNADLVCSFEHSAPVGGNRHLGAAALHRFEDQLYMFTCNWDCERLYVYSLDPWQDECGAILISDSAVSSDATIRSPIADSSDANWGAYNSLATFENSEGDLFVVAGHSGWLDTWRVEGAYTSSPHFNKLAKAKWGQNQAEHGERGMFYEGMVIEIVDAESIDVWAAPHDYGQDGCPAGDCTRAIYQCRLEF